MAVALVTADEYKEKSRRRGVWDRRPILILSTSLECCISVLLAQKQALNLDREMLAFNLI